MSGMHSGNWGNGSAYDANMGENMNIEEIGSVLRWHEVNGTYPARTIKATLYDNEEGGLIGSGDYSAAGTAAAIVAAPTAVGDTNIKVTSTSNLGVGTTIALDEANTENPTVASTGTAATNTTLVGPNSAGDTVINVASVSGITAGQTLKVDLGNVDTSTAATVGTAQRTATTLAAAAAAGDTNIKVASVTNMVAGERIALDVGFSNVEYDKITAVGTASSGGTGVTLQTPLAGAHANGASAQDLGSGITLTTPLSFAHPTGARVIDASALGTGITLTAPLTLAHAYGSTVNGSATGLMSDSPQGQIIGVFNNDQDGLNYPAPKWGTDHYLNDLVNGGIGPWFNNINATPVSAAPNSIYGAVGIQRLQHNLPAVQAFRNASANAVTQALQDLGQKYNFSIPLENPLVLKNTGSVPDNPAVQTRPAYMPARPGAVHAGPGRPHRSHRPGLVRRPRDSVARRHRAVRLEHQPARRRQREPVPDRLSEQADAVRDVRPGLDQRLLLEPELLGLGNGSRAGRLRPAVRGPAARRRVHRDLVLVRDRLAAGRRRGGASRSARSRTSR